ncbi:Ribosomal protein S12p Asp88 (E. coli) methylthiotransferase [hydrothermal vent metagenome]|uniref:Ribosomal protein S12p Asp88 (E. coli) methylthiotransferase n=1 Tax=hydrothermal vent metagenome TaxID=652676 RepID=A0A3B1CCS2_9ZZZZ
MVSLGCPKNRVDSERTLWALKEAGVEITDDESLADLFIANTCGFTADAKEESIETILRLAKIKEERPGRKLAVMGCLTERYGEELKDSVPEIDHIYGIARLREVIEDLAPDPSSVYPDPDAGPRLLTTAPHWAYLKIAEGCSNTCSFCVIPSIRGPYRSRNLDSLIAEATALAGQGVKELIVVAQDTTLYGADLRLDNGLENLLRQLARIDGIEWIRSLYMYPRLISDRLLDFFAGEEKMAPYFDLPLQHISNSVLRRMNRPDTSESIQELIDRIRAKIPAAALRASFIVGFPGETDGDFDQLLQFAKETRFDHLGAFIYSPEEGTGAYSLTEKVEDDIALERYDTFMRTQKEIVDEKAREKTGKNFDIIVDPPGAEDMLLTGRMITQAPEIDGVVILDSVEARPGDIISVKITGSVEYDLIGTDPRI